MSIGDPGTAVWDGSAWHDVTATIPHGAFDCVSATYCLAVTSAGEACVSDGSSWTPGPSSDHSILTLACPAVDDCWADTDNASVSDFDGSTWSRTQQIAPTGPDHENDMTVRCATATTCVALDEIGNVYRFAAGS